MEHGHGWNADETRIGKTGIEGWFRMRVSSVDVLCTHPRFVRWMSAARARQPCMAFGAPRTHPERTHARTGAVLCYPDRPDEVARLAGAVSGW
jgi:hypothetical protein